MPAMEMDHTIDPKEVIINSSKDYVSKAQLTGAEVLIGVYVRPEKTKGGIVLTDAYREEDVFQGKVGLILALGPIPFDKNDDHFFGGVYPKVGDWVVYRPSDGFPISLPNKQSLRLLEDRRQIKMIIGSPDIIW